MVSSVLVELMGDEGIRETLAGEVGKTKEGILLGDVALGVGEEGIFGVKVEIVGRVPFYGLKRHTAKKWGQRDTSEIYKKRDLFNIGSRFSAWRHTRSGLAPRRVPHRFPWLYAYNG